jgi:hypothetical protein
MADTFAGEDKIKNGVNAVMTRANAAVNNTRTAVSKGFNNLLTVPDHLGNTLNKVSSFSNTASFGAMLGLPALAMAGAWKWPRKIPLLGSMLGVGGKLAAINEAELGKLGHETKQVFDAASGEVRLGKNALQHIGSVGEKMHNGIGRYAQNTMGKTQLGSKALSGLSKTTVSNAIFGGTLVVGEGATMAMTAARRIRVLRQMEADITGKPAPSPAAIIMGNHLSPLVLQARRELMGGKAALGTLLQAGAVVGNIWLFVRNASLVKQLAFGAGAAGAGILLASGDTILTAYDNLNQHFAQAGRGSLEDYQGVIDGFVKHGDNRVLQNFAKQCVEEQVTPPELLRRIAVLKKTITARAPLAPVGRTPTPTIGINTAKVNARRALQPSSEAAILAN